jgi:release factor glutamine methyltransferase
LTRENRQETHVVSVVHSVRALLKQGIEKLRAAHIPSDTLAAELLLLHVVARDRTWLYAHPEEIVPDAVAEAYFVVLERRVSGVPTQHLTGKQEFWGLEFEVSPDVLIPRPETEHLIEVALHRLAVRALRAGREQHLSGENLTLVDLGTGSGCLAVALAKELPRATVYGTDISEPALCVARRNADRHGLVDRVHFLHADLLDGLLSPSGLHSPFSFDLVVSNPPYIGLREDASLPVEVREHEPQVALFGGEEGYEMYGALIPQAAQLLKPGGLLVLELGYNSLPAVRPLLDCSAWTEIAVTEDLAGISRVISAERTPFCGLLTDQ